MIYKASFRIAQTTQSITQKPNETNNNKRKSKLQPAISRALIWPQACTQYTYVQTSRQIFIHRKQVFKKKQKLNLSIQKDEAKPTTTTKHSELQAS